MTQRTWFITGVSSGLGRIMAEQLLEQGDRVAGTARKPETLNDLKTKFGEQLWTAALDVTDTAAIRQVVGEAFGELGQIDVVVSNAGYALFGAAEELTDEQIGQQVATNFTGSIQLIRAALPHLRAQGGGRILQVSSASGQVAFPGYSLYSATKWGIEGFVEAAAQEVTPFGIEFTIVEPGATKTNFVGGQVYSEPLAAYENTPADAVRRAVAEGAFPIPGDAAKVVRAMIDSVGVTPAPKRLALGSDTYALLHAAWKDRLAALHAQKDIAFSTDSTHDL